MKEGSCVSGVLRQFLGPMSSSNRVEMVCCCVEYRSPFIPKNFKSREAVPYMVPFTITSL